MTRLALLLADLANDGSDCFHIHPHASVNQILASDLSTLSTVPSPCGRESDRARARASEQANKGESARERELSCVCVCVCVRERERERERE